MNEVLEFLKNCKVFFVATAEQGKPKVRPFSFVMMHEEKLYFVTLYFTFLYLLRPASFYGQKGP